MKKERSIESDAEKYKSREIEKQRNREAEKQKGRKAERRKGGKAEKQRNSGAKDKLEKFRVIELVRNSSYAGPKRVLVRRKNTV